MPAYEYLALDVRGKEKKGFLEAETARLARQLLRQQSLTPLEVNETNAGGKSRGKSNVGGGATNFRGGLKSNDLALVTRQIATLSAAGTPLEEALSAVSRQTEKPRIKALMLSVRSRVLEGHTLASALGDYPKVFPEIYQATVAAGEQSGHLDAVLERLADYTEERQVSQSVIKKALIYPTMLVVASILIVSFLLAYVVPQVRLKNSFVAITPPSLLTPCPFLPRPVYRCWKRWKFPQQLLPVAPCEAPYKRPPRKFEKEPHWVTH